jgi:hypothetical protein
MCQAGTYGRQLIHSWYLETQLSNKYSGKRSYRDWVRRSLVALLMSSAGRM